MAGFNKKNTQQWKIESARITADRGVNLDVTNSVMELVLYESLDKPYCTGRVAIAVADSFVDDNNFLGSERLSLIIKSQSGDEEPQSSGLETRDFVMFGMETSTKSNEEGTTSVYVFGLVDEHAVANKVKRISRTIGNGLPLEVEILKIVAELGKNCEINLNGKTKQGTKWKGYIPYLSPLEAAEWLRDRATTETEMPLFLYGTMHSNNLKLSSLDYLMSRPSINPSPEERYLFSPADLQRSEYEISSPTTKPIEKKERFIKSIRPSKMQNQWNLAMQGATGALFSTTNINGDPLGEGDIQSIHHPITRTIGLMEGAGITRGDQQNVYDPQWNVEGVGVMHDNDAVIIHQILSENEYTKDWNSIHFESEIEKHQSKLSTIAMMAMLYKNCFEVTLDGAKFLKKKAGVGDIVSIEILADYLEIDKREGDFFDKLKSGDFLILNIRHTFQIPDHTVGLTVTKVSRRS